MGLHSGFLSLCGLLVDELFVGGGGGVDVGDDDEVGECGLVL